MSESSSRNEFITLGVMAATIIVLVAMAFIQINKTWKARDAVQEAMRVEASRQVDECEAAGGSVSYVKTSAFRGMFPVRGADGNVACEQGE